MRDGCATKARHAGTRLLAVAFAAGLGLPCGALQAGQAMEPALPPGGVEIRRTADGIPHLLARDWRGLGVGIGHVQAEDALCTLADAFVTYEGRRSYFFGPEGRPAHESTLGKPLNLELDFFFKTFADQDLVSRYRAAQPPELDALVQGYVAGYNRYLAEIRTHKAKAKAHACVAARWVRAIAPDDVYRRLFAANIAAGLAHFIPEIVNARPGGDVQQARSMDETLVALQATTAHSVGDRAGLGSNMIAFGQQATGGQGGVLFGNPHWYWGGPDRFYQMHLRIPGKLNVAGVAFLGVPLVMIGFNEQVAWSHTVSKARRFGLYDLTLDPADPTRYVIDGVSEAMGKRQVTIDLPNEKGQARRLTRTLYGTRFGPVVDLSARDQAAGWGRERAIALRDVNMPNFRIFRNFLAWNQAPSLDEFVAIQRREAALPWVNTAAIGRGKDGRADGRVWYGDVGAVPNAPDALRERCSTPMAKAFARMDASTPFLDGSRSDCDWLDDPRAALPGAMPGLAMPGLLREDYVANMNDSYWLGNPLHPLEGYPSVLGGERQPLSLRGRLGHRLAQTLIEARLPSPQALSRRLMVDALAPRAYSAELFKQALLDEVCQRPVVVLPEERSDAKQATVKLVPIGRACDVLRRWKNTAEASDRGALLWDAFWTRLDSRPDGPLYLEPFSSDRPLTTPGQPGARDPEVVRALAQAVEDFRQKGWALDAPVGSQRYVLGGGRKVPLYGGCHVVGYFVVACGDDGPGMNADALANSYLQVVRFDERGVVAHTLLAHGQHEGALVDGQGLAPVMRYARKQWLRFPFSEDEIARAPGVLRTVLMP